MSKKLYVGGLPYSTSENDLHDLFQEHGTVVSSVIISDRDSGRSKGFGFVEMSTQEEAQNAVSKLNGENLGGRSIVVNEARERAHRPATNSRW